MIEDRDLDDEDRVLTISEIIAAVRLSHEGVNFAGDEGAREIIHELWGSGWTFTRRRRGDPFDVPTDAVPAGMSYQWTERSKITAAWTPVPTERHDGLFAPAGTGGDIEVGGMVLVERKKQDVDAEQAQRVAKAHQNVEDWKAKFGGFSGGVRVWTGDEDKPPAWQAVGEQVLAQRITEAPRAADPLPPAPTIDLPKVETTKAPLQRVPRHPLLAWLFNLISKEA